MATIKETDSVTAEPVYFQCKSSAVVAALRNLGPGQTENGCSALVNAAILGDRRPKTTKKELFPKIALRNSVRTVQFLGGASLVQPEILPTEPVNTSEYF